MTSAVVTIAGQAIIYKVSPAWSAGAAGPAGTVGPAAGTEDLDRSSRRTKLHTDLKKAQKRNKALKHASISHTLHLGGWALSSAPVGFDLEPRGRKISAKALKWYARTGEIERARSRLKLWVMKEAAFKALRGPLQPATIRHVQISRCRRSSQNENLRFFFKLKRGRKTLASGEGRLNCSPSTIMGFATLIS